MDVNATAKEEQNAKNNKKKKKKIVVVGGGIAGCCVVAELLRRRRRRNKQKGGRVDDDSYEILLLEKDESETARRQGYGLTISETNSAIEKLGIYEELKKNPKLKKKVRSNRAALSGPPRVPQQVVEGSNGGAGAQRARGKGAGRRGAGAR